MLMESAILNSKYDKEKINDSVLFELFGMNETISFLLIIIRHKSSVIRIQTIYQTFMLQ